MAKGIISARPSVDKPGIIVAVDNNSAEPGNRYTFTSPATLNPGDLVEFTATSSTAAGSVVLVQAGQLITTPVTGDLTVASGKSCLLRGTSVSGNVSVNGGYLLMDSSATISGGLTLAANSYVAANTINVAGQTNSSASGSVLALLNCSHRNHIQSAGNRFVKIQSCSVIGNLSVTSAGTCKCSSNTVSGTTNTPGCTSTPAA